MPERTPSLPTVLGRSLLRSGQAMAAPFEIDTAGVDDELLAFRLGSMSIIAFGVPLLLSDQALSSFAKPPSAVHGPLTAALSLVGLGWLLQKSWRHLSTAVKTPDSPTQTSSEDSKLAAPVEQPAAATDVATDAEAVHPSNSGTPDGEVLDPMDIPPAPTVPVPSEAPEEPQAEAPGPHLQNSRTETGDVVAPALHTDDSAPQKYAQPVQNEPGWETVDRHPPTATNGIPSAPPASLVHGMPSAPPASLVFSKLAPEAELADRGRHTQLSGHNDDGSTANEARTQLASLGDGTRIEQAQEALRRSRPHCRPYGPLTDTLENFDTMETRLKDGRVSTGQPPEYFADVFIKKWHNEWWPMIQKQGPMRLGDSEMNPISFLDDSHGKESYSPVIADLRAEGHSGVPESTPTAHPPSTPAAKSLPPFYRETPYSRRPGPEMASTEEFKATVEKIIGELAADREKIRTAREALGGLGVESYQMGKPAEYDLTNTPSPR